MPFIRLKIFKYISSLLIVFNTNGNMDIDFLSNVFYVFIVVITLFFIFRLWYGKLYLSLFFYVGPVLHSWNKPDLVILHYLFHVLLCLLANIFLRLFLYVLIYTFRIFTWFLYHDNASFIKWGKIFFYLSYILEVVCRLMIFLLQMFTRITIETNWAWIFLC